MSNDNDSSGILILGDLASPNIQTSGALKDLIDREAWLFNDKKIIVNFEGLIFDGAVPDSNEPLLFNHPSVMDVIGEASKSVLCLANNHVLDMPQQFNETIQTAKSYGHMYCGAGSTREQAVKPLHFTVGKRRVALFNACWNFLLYNHRNPRSGVHVAEINEMLLIREVEKTRQATPDITIIVYLHWNLDMETLPFPMYRQFSRDLVSAGAKLVVGTHSHCIQGGEKINDSYVLYGLGNFLIPNQEYAGGNLSFPASAETGLVLEWSFPTETLNCHWFNYQKRVDGHLLQYIGGERFENSKMLDQYSPYTGMKDDEYVDYYKINRRKKLLIPIYKDYRNISMNRLYTLILITRAKVAHFLAKMNILKWQN